VIGSKQARPCHLPPTLKLLDISENKIADGL